MSKGIALAMAISAASPMLQTVRPGPTMLEQLTAPAERLPYPCGLSATPSVRLEGEKVLTGLWGGNLPITVNPWTGNDPRLIALIRERMYGLPPAPDGPPLGGRQASRYRLRLADGVEEGYAAFYQESQTEATAVSVYALKFADPEKIPRRPNVGNSNDRMVTWLEIGEIAAVVVGNFGPCSQAIETYVKSLMKRD